MLGSKSTSNYIWSISKRLNSLYSECIRRKFWFLLWKCLFTIVIRTYDMKQPQRQCWARLEQSPLTITSKSILFQLGIDIFHKYLFTDQWYKFTHTSIQPKSTIWWEMIDFLPKNENENIRSRDMFDHISIHSWCLLEAIYVKCIQCYMIIREIFSQIVETKRTVYMTGIYHGDSKNFICWLIFSSNFSFYLISLRELMMFNDHFCLL